MKVAPGIVCVVVGGAEHRPQDIGQSCTVVRWLEPGEIFIHSICGIRNGTGEACWIVELADGMHFKRTEWLMPIDPGAENKSAVLEIIQRSKV